MTKDYPDISHYEEVRRWKDIRRYCPFIISKATQGTSYVDPTLEEVIRKCEKKGIPYWLYAYLNRGDERKQVEFLIRACKHKIGKNFVGYVLDVEDGNAPAEVKRALDYLRKQEHKMMLYTMYAQYGRYKELIQKRPRKCAWWEARYGTNNGRYNPAYPCHAGADLHQFTSKGSCPGIEGPVDLNRVTGHGRKERWFMTPRRAENL